MQKNTENPLTVCSESELSATTLQENHQWIAESAYYKALARSFSPNRDQEDWLEAKKDYEEMLSNQQRNGLVSLRQNNIVSSACKTVWKNDQRIVENSVENCSPR